METRDAILAKLEQLARSLRQDAAETERRLECVRRTARQIIDGREVASCGLPHGDFSDRSVKLTAAVDALMQLEADREMAA